MGARWSQQADIPSMNSVFCFARTATEMVEGARELRAAVTRKQAARAKIKVINRSAAGLEEDERVCVASKRRGWC